MPNHVHGIIIIKGKESPKEMGAQKKQCLCASVGGFKTWSARRINFLLDRTGTPFWQ
jgi:REP element-mobilizing transposase RayT